MELIEALNRLREECKKHVNCTECPLRDIDNSCCALHKSSPCMWDLKVDHNVPRLFV